MGLLDELMQQTKKIDFLFPNSFEELMNSKYYDYDKFEWFLYYVFKLDGSKVQKMGKKGKGDGGADLILTIPQDSGGLLRVGVQAKYWKNRVGTEPVNQLASAKSRHNLTHLWIITTSDLTSDAKEIAESMDISILRREDVKKFIETIKHRYEKDIEEKGESSIEFLKPDKKKTYKSDKVSAKPQQSEKAESNHISLMKDLRKEISKKYKLYPIYTVYNNEVMAQLIKEKPTTIEALMKIKGFGEKKVQLFGEDVIVFIKENLVAKKVSSNKSGSTISFFDFLISERPKIAKFNNLSEAEVYDDQTAKNIVKMKPRSKNALRKVFGFKECNIEIFGDYLIRKITPFLDEPKSN